MTSAAPHSKLTIHERRDLALHLAGVVMLPERLSIADTASVEQLGQAHQRMLAARWDEQAADLLEMVIRPAEEAAAELRVIREAQAAGRMLNPREVVYLLPEGLWREAAAGLEQGVVADQDGNYDHVFFWRADQPSPWRKIGTKAYAALLAGISDAFDPLSLEHLRHRAAYVWSHLNEDERRSFS